MRLECIPTKCSLYNNTYTAKYIDHWSSIMLSSVGKSTTMRDLVVHCNNDPKVKPYRNEFRNWSPDGQYIMWVYICSNYFKVVICNTYCVHRLFEQILTYYMISKNIKIYIYYVCVSILVIIIEKYYSV